MFKKNVMTLEALKRWRLLVPGIMILLFGLYYYSIIYGKAYAEIDLTKISLQTIVVVVFGGCYYLLSMRYIITNYSQKIFVKNIKDKLCAYYSGNISEEQKEYLLKNKDLISVFYDTIDNDSSLKQQQKIIYSNGLFWTSTADIIVISLIYSILFFSSIYWFDVNKDELLRTGLILLIVAVVSLLFHVIAVVKHVKLSNNQLGVIKTIHQSVLDQKITAIIQNI